MTHAPRAIAFIINSLEFGGAQRVCIDDANDFFRAGYDVSFFVLYGKSGEFPFEKELDSGVHLQFLGARSAFDFSAVAICAHQIRRARTAVLISTLNDGNMFARWVVLRVGRSVRLIQREANTLSSKTARQKCLDVFCMWIPYRIIALSSEAEASLKRLMPFAHKKIVRLPNAVSIPIPIPAHQNHLVPVILSVGRLTSQKNYSLLISALGVLARGGVEYRAIIIGEGFMRKELEKQIASEGISERVVLLGNLPHEAVLEWYANADVFVSTSLWEGSPNVVLEAMAHALPVVATDVGGVRDSITSREGLIVPSKDEKALVGALRQVLLDASLRRAYGMAGYERTKSDFSRAARFTRLRAIVGEI